MHKHNRSSSLTKKRFTLNWNCLESLVRDLCYSVRTLARTPVFSATAVLVMGLGIGANVALFTIVPQPMMYFALDANSEMTGAALVVRSDLDVTTLALPIQRMIAQLDRDMPVSDVLTMDQVLHRNTMETSFDVTLLLVFAALSLLLAAVGLFGVLSYIVAQRTGEIGIRMALGAQREQILSTILIDGLRPAFLGLFLGLLGSAAVVRLMGSMLYETAPLDPTVFITVSGTLLVVVAIACVFPAWRASRLDPMQVLRT
jgi:putative ABC transport system permease protein